MRAEHALWISFPQETEARGDFPIFLKKVCVGMRN